jgi:hypothetical protein
MLVVKDVHLEQNEKLIITEVTNSDNNINTNYIEKEIVNLN